MSAGPPADGRVTARVTAAYGRRGRLATAAGETLRYLVRGRRLKVVCGDIVDWEPAAHGDEAIVTGIQPRRNALTRIAPDRNAPEILAANLSLIVVVIAPTPATDWHLTDRYLAAATLMGCDALIADNKTDLCPAGDPARRAALDVYAGLGHICITLSATTGNGIEALRAALADETAVLVGQSGVGKSSLINCLVPDARITVGELSQASDEGTHTTTASAMHRLTGGGRLIDTPGVRDFMPAIPADANVQDGFPEIRTRAAECRFANCRHLREPDCAVKKAVAAGAIDARRFETYRRMARAD